MFEVQGSTFYVKTQNIELRTLNIDLNLELRT